MRDVDDHGQIYTYILIKDDIMINFHRIESSMNLFLREGGYSQGFNVGQPKVVSSDNSIAIYADGKVSYVRNLYGYENNNHANRYTELVEGSNGTYEKSMTPVLWSRSSPENPFYLVCMVCGRIGNYSIEELDSLVTQFSLDDNKAYISFYDGEKAFLQIGDIQKVRIELDGKKLNGKIVAARVSSDRKEWFTIKQPNKIIQKVKSRILR